MEEYLVSAISNPYSFFVHFINSETTHKLNMLKMHQNLGYCQTEYFPKRIFVEHASKHMLKICHLGCCQKERRGKICRGCQREPATLKLNTVNCKIEYLRLKTGETCQLSIEKIIISDLMDFNNSLISYKYLYLK